MEVNSKQSLSGCGPSISRLPPSVIAALMLSHNELFRADGKSNIVTRLFKQTQTEILPRTHFDVCCSWFNEF